MMFSPGTKADAAVYDPSNRCADTASYWQWSNGPLDVSWDRAAETVNQGWPVRIEPKDHAGRWYGAIVDSSGALWVYRLYAGGKDRFGREGRYFFVLLCLQSVEDLISPRSVGLFRYFEAERGLPLKIDPLDHGWPDGTPDEHLFAIRDGLAGNRIAGHWGFDGTHEAIRLSSSDVVPEGKHGTRPPLPVPPAVEWTRQSRRQQSAFVAVAIAISLGVFLMTRGRRQGDGGTLDSDNGRTAPPAAGQGASPFAEGRPDDTEKNERRREESPRVPRVERKPMGEAVPMEDEPSQKDSGDFDDVVPSNPPAPPLPDQPPKSPTEHQPPPPGQ